MKIPFVFVTGYGGEFGLPPALNGTPMLPKPCTTRCAWRPRMRQPRACEP